MKSLFVTGTGTDIGKTFVTCRLIECWLPALPLRCIKPVVSGFNPDDPQQSDPGRLLSAQSQPISDATLAATSPWRFRLPISADMAAARAGCPIPFDELIRFCEPPNGPGINLIEGFGGVMAPLDQQRTVLDWIAATDAAVLLVAGSYLGSLSHTLTALQALASRSLAPVAIVLSQSETEPVPTSETAVTLARFAGTVPIVTIARSATADAAELAALLVRTLDPD